MTIKMKFALVTAVAGMGEWRRLKMFNEFPDVLTINDMKKALGVSNKMAYSLISSGKIKYFRLGKLIKIPKRFLVDYIESECYTILATVELPCQNERGTT
jgi:excisionase family DNA binding protein